MLASRFAIAIALGLCSGCSPNDGTTTAQDDDCPAQPRFCEPFTFVRGDDGLSLRWGFDEDVPAPASDVHCVLEAIRDGTHSTHTFTDGFPSVSNGAGSFSRIYQARTVRVFEDGHVEVFDSATESFEDPATPEPRTAHFEIQPDPFFDTCLASSDATELRDCLWALEAEQVPESGCRPPVGVPSRGGATSGE